VTERPLDEPDSDGDEDESEFDRFEALTKKLLDAKPKDGPPEVEDAARDELEIPADETDEG
jgi:hypothetical protein